MGSSRKSLVVYDWKTVSSLWSCYLHYLSSRILGVVVQVTDSPHLFYRCPRKRRSPSHLGPSSSQSLQIHLLKPPRSHRRATRRRLSLILEPGYHTRIIELFIYCSFCFLHPYTCPLSFLLL